MLLANFGKITYWNTKLLEMVSVRFPFSVMYKSKGYSLKIAEKDRRPCSTNTGDSGTSGWNNNYATFRQPVWFTVASAPLCCCTSWDIMKPTQKKNDTHSSSNAAISATDSLLDPSWSWRRLVPLPHSPIPYFHWRHSSAHACRASALFWLARYLLMALWSLEHHGHPWLAASTSRESINAKVNSSVCSWSVRGSPFLYPNKPRLCRVSRPVQPKLPVLFSPGILRLRLDPMMRTPSKQYAVHMQFKRFFCYGQWGCGPPLQWHFQAMEEQY